MKKHLLSFVLLALTLGFSANAWAYTISGGSVTFAKNEVITIDFSGVQTFNDFEEKGKLNADYSINGTTVTVTFKDSKTINSGDEMFHYKGCGEWSHNNIEWFKLKSSGSSATDGIPCPDKTGYNKLIVTDNSCKGAATFTWSTGSTPTPTTKYYIKNNWNSGTWAWQEMSPSGDGDTWTYTGVFGSWGVNINTKADDNGKQEFEKSKGKISGDEFDTDDNVTFTYTVSSNTVSARNNSNPCANCKTITKP